MRAFEAAREYLQTWRPFSDDEGDDIDSGVDIDSFIASNLTNTELDDISLFKTIQDRMAYMKSKPTTWSPPPHEATEYEKLMNVETARLVLLNWRPFSNDEGEDIDGQANPIKRFDSQWMELQKFYYQRARGIFVTAVTAGIKPLRVAKIQVVINEEAPQTQSWSS